jgi:hypothetical protein
MTRFGKQVLAALVVALGACLSASPAAAQFSRTWVASNGVDTAICSRQAPCRTFQAAQSRTLPGGQISCVDGASYAPVIIVQALTIECEASPGGIIVNGGNAITIAAADTDVVQIRGLQIAGLQPTSCCGILFVSGASLVLDHVAIRNFYGDYGIAFEPSTAAKLYVSDSTIANNGNGSGGGGILVQPVGTGTASVVINRVLIQNNNGQGVLLSTMGNTGSASQVEIKDSQISGNAQGVMVSSPPATSFALVSIANTSVTRNTTYGLISSGPLARMTVTGATITWNGTGVFADSGSQIASFGDNMLFTNGVNGTFNPKMAKQ